MMLCGALAPMRFTLCLSRTGLWSFLSHCTSSSHWGIRRPGLYLSTSSLEIWGQDTYNINLSQCLRHYPMYHVDILKVTTPSVEFHTSFYVSEPQCSTMNIIHAKADKSMRSDFIPGSHCFEMYVIITRRKNTSFNFYIQYQRRLLPLTVKSYEWTTTW